MEWIYGLNILRLFAIVLILVYHFFPNVLPGGFIAVELFFVFSGFLLISKIIRSYAETGRVRFWKTVGRRFLGLFLPLALSVVICLAIGLLVDKEVLVGARKNSLAALGFATNITQLISGGSYEESVLPNIFEHTWFLALLMQANIAVLLIAKLFLGGGEWRKEIAHLGLLLLALSVVSIAMMVCYGGVFGYMDRAYFAPDTHMFAYLLGATFAVWNFLHPRLPRTSKRLPFLGTVLILAVLVVFARVFSYSDSNTFLFVLPASALLAVGLLFLLLRLQKNAPSKPNWLIRFFEYLGSLSFWVYLYHWPLKIILPHLLGESLLATTTVTISIATSFVLAIISRIIASQFKAPIARKAFYPSLRAVFTVIISIALVFATLDFARAPQESAILAELQKNETPTTEAHGGDLIVYAPTIEKLEIMRPFVGATADDSFSKEKEFLAVSSAVDAKVLLIGDSVPLGAKETMERNIEGIYVDAEESRGIEAASGLLAEYIGDGASPDIIVISLVTNQRTITDELLDDIIASGGEGRSYIFMTGYAGPSQPREEQNSVLVEYASAHSNVRIADWWNIAAHDWSLMYSDHIHLNPDGRETYSNLIQETIKSFGKADDENI